MVGATTGGMSTEKRVPLRLVDPVPERSSPAIAVPGPRPTTEPLAGVEPIGDGTAPDASECLPCYVDRMVTRHGCDNTLRWSLHWRDARAPRAAKLDRRLEDRGGFCDCEVLFNAFRWHFPESSEPDDPGSAEARPSCSGRSRGSAMEPCRPPEEPWWW